MKSKFLRQSYRRLLVPDRNKYIFLLISLLSIVVIAPQLSLTIPRNVWLLEILLFGTVISSLYTLKKSRLKRNVCIVLTVLIPMFDLIGLSSNISWLLVLARSSLMILYLILITTIVEDIVESEVINRDTICGAVCGFMLLATLFGTIYTLLYTMDATHFNLPKDRPTSEAWFELLYFSYITITSVGYGDVTPASTAARSIVIIQSVSGTFYLATLVAHIVSGLDRSHTIEKLENVHKEDCNK